jgi:DNA-binding response OmpR family regulator
MKNKKILVVDDDESILDAICLILEDEGYLVETTTKGQEIYTKIKEFTPDIILLDVLMSGSDGRQICRTLKDDVTTKQIPIVMISAHPSANIGSLECGADDFLAKPFTTDDLLEKITKNI